MSWGKLNVSLWLMSCNAGDQFICCPANEEAKNLGEGIRGSNYSSELRVIFHAMQQAKLQHVVGKLRGGVQTDLKIEPQYLSALSESIS
jgi:hypothetical protein